MGEPSAKIRERVESARERQHRQFGETNLKCNGDMGPGEVTKSCTIDDAGRRLLRAAMQQMSKTLRRLRGQMSARAYHRILTLARTMADVAESDKIETAHIAEAIQYRSRKQF